MDLFLRLALVFTTSISAAQADSPLPFNGRIYTDQYIFTNPQPNSTNDIAQSSASLWLEWDSKANASDRKGFGAHVVGQFDAFYRSMTQPLDSSFSAFLREGYASYSNEAIDLRVGQQIIPWGKSDGVNPTDYFTAKNYTVLNPDDEVRRIGAPGGNLSFTPNNGASPISIQAVFQAYYPQTSLLIPDRAIPAGLEFIKYPGAPNAFDPNAMEYGIKISYLGNAFDCSLSYYQGVSHFSEYVFIQSENRVVPINPKQSAVGGDASFTAGDYIFRLESALLMPENGQDTDPLFGIVEPWHWDTVIGIERPFLQDFRIQLQFLLRQHLYYQDPSEISAGNVVLTQINQAVAQGNALILNFQQQTNEGATLRLSYSNDQSPLTADVFLIGYFANGQDFLLRPQMGYKPIDNLKFTLGIDLYGGEASRPLGALHDQSAWFFEGKYTF